MAILVASDSLTPEGITINILALCFAIVAVLASIGFATWIWFAVSAVGAEWLDLADLDGANFETK